MYISAVHISTSIAVSLTHVNLSLTPFNISSLQNNLILKPPPFDITCTWKPFPVGPLNSTTSGYGPLEGYYTCIYLKYLDHNRRLAQCSVGEVQFSLVWGHFFQT